MSLHLSEGPDRSNQRRRPFASTTCCIIPKYEVSI